jgi:hypothetical protein
MIVFQPASEEYLTPSTLLMNLPKLKILTRHTKPVSCTSTYVNPQVCVSLVL